MLKHVETILTSAGITPEDIKAIDAVSEEDQATFDARPYAEKVRANYQTQFKNDPEFFSGITLENLPPAVKKQVENAGFGRASKIVTDKFLKGIGMTEADYVDLPQETKEKIELLIPAIAERYTKTKTGDKEIQNQLIEARKRLESFDGYEDKIKTQYETEANGKIAGAIFNANLIGALSEIPGLKIAASDIAKTANDILQQKFAFERVGDFSVELRQKANPTMKVLKDGSSHELTLKEALADIATERGWVEKASGDTKGSGVTKVIPGNDGNLHMVAPHLRDKISQKIAAEA